MINCTHNMVHIIENKFTYSLYSSSISASESLSPSKVLIRFLSKKNVYTTDLIYIYKNI